jgi:hypothetical protein
MTAPTDERTKEEYPAIIAEMAEQRRRGQPLSQREREGIRRLQHLAAIDAQKKRQVQGE